MPGGQRIVVIGGSGQLGTALLGELESRDVPACAPSSAELDLLALDRVGGILAALSPTAVINAAAYNDVSRADTPPHDAMAYRLNRDAPAALAHCCRELAIPFVHVSTDYVFDGEKGEPYTEDDSTSPLQVYGRSKLEGERAVTSAHPDAIVGRTSTVFGPSRRGSSNFIQSILRNARRSGGLDVVSTPVSSPTYAVDLARALLDLLEVGATGLVHVANGGACGRYELAVETIRLSGLDVEVRETASSPDGVLRPAYSVLDTARLARLTGRSMRSWAEALRDYLV